MTELVFDLESRSELSLPDTGLYNYAHHASTKVLMCSFAFDSEPVELWEAWHKPMPDRFKAALTDPKILKLAWSLGFERKMFRAVLGIDIPLRQCFDIQIQSRYLSIPGHLSDASEILRLGEQGKMKEGANLIQMFSMPAKIGTGEPTLFGPDETAFRDWNSYPREWEQFCSYCVRDTVAERAIWNKLKKFQLPKDEIEGWYLDQEINETGWPVDLDFVQSANKIVAKAQATLREQMSKLTGLENPNSRDQILEWLRERQYPFNALSKGLVQRALDWPELPKEAREALLLRRQLSKTSATKLGTIEKMVAKDGRLRDQYTFFGAARTGRWSSRDGIQIQNLPRPTKTFDQRTDEIIPLIQKEDYESLELFYSPVMEVMASSLRSAFRAPAGKKFVIGDLSGVENRGIGWICGCDEILKVYRDGLDPYLAFAVKLYGKPYEQLLADYKSGRDKETRQNSKPAVLGAGYRLSGGEEITNKDDDVIYTGLWGYAKGMGVELSRDEAHRAVKVFRESYSEVVSFWKELEQAAARAMAGSKTEIGPVTMDRVGNIFRILLPSGRFLHYIRPKMETQEVTGWNGDTYRRESLTYEGTDVRTKQWTRIFTHGGHLLENCTQAICRDLLLHGMKSAAKSLQLVGHSHDEIVALADENDSEAELKLQQAMTSVPSWATGFPLDAEVKSSERYAK